MVTTKRRPAATRAPARKKTAGTQSRSRTTRSPAKAPPSILRTHAADLWAIGLITLAVLLALALWGHQLGPVGHDINTAASTVMGWARIILPLVCAGAGVVLLVERERPDPLRTGLGAALGLIGVCGLAELAKGAPRITNSQGLRKAGGWVGALIGHPLRAGIGSAGAAVLFVAVVVVAVLITTGVSLASFGRGVRLAASAIGRTIWTWWKGGPLDESEQEPEVRPVRTRAPKAVPASPAPALFDAEDDASPSGHDAVPEPEPTLPPKPKVVAVPRASGEWQLPSLDLLPATKQLRQDERQLDAAGVALVAALDAHGVTTNLIGRTVGPTVTRFELELGPGVKVARVTSLSKDIAYAMASPDVRILAPIPGKSAIGVEVPNRTRQLVALRDILDSPEAVAATHPLEVAFGRDIAGRAVMANLAEMPHILVSGATGAGKSSMINSIITSILMRSTPEQVRLMLIDPKRVELGQYNGLQHLILPVVVDPKKAANALQWAVKEMERRYDILAENGLRDITGYNQALEAGEIGPIGPPSIRRKSKEAAVRALGADHSAIDSDDEIDDEPQPPEILPFILIVVDELNDLMMVAARDVEDSVVRIAQMARAVGIHLVLATQRPSVDVITGVIKANVPSRMAFSVSSLADSRVILDQPGAERLIGKGDMLLLTASSNIPRRLQGPWVSEEDVRKVVSHWHGQGGMAELAVGIENIAELPGGIEGVDDDDDDLLSAAMDLVVRSQLGSTSMLQRKLRVGFARAGRLMDLLERRGVVGPSEGSKARQVLMTIDEFDALTHR
ncbi:MAG TPA: DNA translocase FtsK 4TM domain-containing protein [Acidimicrobiales bacterium]|nr:DNA translocase FtsK 4TM domain-containing protein [Acidimicrobiales bacterium]